MSKVRFTDDSYRKEPWFRTLCSAFISCKTEQEMADLLRDIGTLSELQAWSERLEVAKLIAQGMSYREVAKKTGASTTTVTRVAKFIENGPGGYRKFLNAHRHHRMHSKPASVEKTDMNEAKPADTGPQKVIPVTVLQKYLQK